VNEGGFTLIELLVVILIIGILAAIILPSFLSQKNKAFGAQAEEMARSMETAMEAYATNHEGSFTGATLAELHTIEPSIPTATSGTNTHPKGEPEEVSGSSYKVAVIAGPAGTEFVVKRKPNGESEYTCTPPINTNGCPSSGEW
jgi:prepilin-type N-terminal cleavage/methylation domain-containing protein